MRSTLLIAALLMLGMLGACSKGNKSALRISGDGVETDIVRSCAAMQHRVEELYQQAAEQSGMAANRRSEFVSANLHMVMSDCRLNPTEGYACLQEAKSVTELEDRCLVPLDDEGSVEGSRFASEAR